MDISFLKSSAKHCLGKDRRGRAGGGSYQIVFACRRGRSPNRGDVLCGYKSCSSKTRAQQSVRVFLRVRKDVGFHKPFPSRVGFVLESLPLLGEPHFVCNAPVARAFQSQFQPPLVESGASGLLQDWRFTAVLTTPTSLGCALRSI